MNVEKAVVRGRGAKPKLVPGIESRQRKRQGKVAHGAPAVHPYDHHALALRSFDLLAAGGLDRRQPTTEVPRALQVAALDVGRQVHVARRFLVELQADQAGDAAELLLCAIGRENSCNVGSMVRRYSSA